MPRLGDKPKIVKPNKNPTAAGKKLTPSKKPSKECFTSKANRKITLRPEPEPEIDLDYGTKVITNNRKAKLPLYSATRTAIKSKDTALQILEMKKKMDDFIAGVKNPHPLLGLLDKKKPLKTQKRITESGDSQLDTPESVTLKESFAHGYDIHKAREVQSLIENRRKYFDGELKLTAFDMRRPQTAVDKGSSDEEDNTSYKSQVSDHDSEQIKTARTGATIGSSMEERLDELSNDEEDFALTNMQHSSGDSDADELSIGDLITPRIECLKEFQQESEQLSEQIKPMFSTTHAPLARSTSVENQKKTHCDLSRRAYSKIEEMLVARRASYAGIDTANTNFCSAQRKTSLPVNYKPRPRNQRRRKTISAEMEKKKVPRVRPKSSFLCVLKKAVPDSTGPHSGRCGTSGKDCFRKVFKTRKEVWFDSSDEGSTCNKLPSPIPKLLVFRSTGPETSHFSMTEVLVCTNELDEAADIENVVGSNEKKWEWEKDPILNVSTRGPTIYTVSPAGDSTDEEFWSNETLMKSENTVPIMKPEPHSVEGYKSVAALTPLKEMYESYKDAIKMKEIERTSAYVSWKLDAHSNGTYSQSYPCTPVMLPELPRYPTPLTLQHYKSTHELSTPIDQARVQVRSTTAKSNTSFTQFAKSTKSKTALKQKVPFIAFSGQKRPEPEKPKKIDKIVPKPEPIKLPEEKKENSRPKIVYNKLQRKRDIPDPGDIDYSKDPRFLALLEVLDPVTAPLNPTWKNMPKQPKDVSRPSAQRLLVRKQVPEKTKEPSSESKSVRRYSPRDPRHVVMFKRSERELHLKATQK